MEVSDRVRASYEAPPAYTQISPGVPEEYKSIKTLGDLLDINYKVVGVKEQMRQNLLARIKSGEDRYPGIIGYDNDVMPALDRAILAGHDMLLVGQMGQAKTRIAETIAKHMLSKMPIIPGSRTNDTPMDMPADVLISLLNDTPQRTPEFHASPETAETIRDNKLDTPIQWVDGLARSRFVVGTTDMTSRDLVGYIDAIKMTQKGADIYSLESYTPGQLMQAKHGVFCVDELPVLDPRKQVTLLSVLQEGRFTTGAYPVTFRPKCMFVATANPTDYTHSGRIIEPLYDRLRSHIHTRHPKTTQDEMAILLQEANLQNFCIAGPVLALLAQTIRNIRDSPLINQEKGVSVRMGIHGLELLVAEAQRVRPQEMPCPRLSDFGCLDQVARFEISEMEDTPSNRKKILEEAVSKAVKESGTGIKQDASDMIKSEFSGKSFTVSQDIRWDGHAASYSAQLSGFPTLRNTILEEASGTASHQSGGSATQPCINAAVTEIVLERLCWSTPRVLERRDSGYVAT